MEPQAVNTLVDESEALKKSVLAEMKGEVPLGLRHLFKETSLFFQEEVLSKWRIEERYDELIDYILYQYRDFGGESFWMQVLLDLRLKGDELRAFRMLEGLLPGRVEKVKACRKNLKKYPNNYLSAVTLNVAKGEALKVLYEYAYIVENKPTDQVDTVKVESVIEQIEKLLSM